MLFFTEGIFASSVTAGKFYAYLVRTGLQWGVGHPTPCSNFTYKKLGVWSWPGRLMSATAALIYYIDFVHSTGAIWWLLPLHPLCYLKAKLWCLTIYLGSAESAHSIDIPQPAFSVLKISYWAPYSFHFPPSLANLQGRFIQSEAKSRT